MALIKCPECNKEISDMSELCIGCGFPISKHIAKQKEEEEILSVDITQECQDIKKIFSDFKNNYVPLSGMRIDLTDVQKINKEVKQKIASLNLQSQKQIIGKFAESFVVGLCEDNNINYVNFEDVKFVCEIIGISNISSQSIKNITQIIYTYMETVSGASGIMPLSWLIGIIFEAGDDEDKILLEETLIKPNAFGNPRKSDVFEVIESLKNSSANKSIAEVSKKEENIPKCPTCQSTDIKKVSTMSKAGSVALWGLFSQKVKKQWHCNNCGSEW